MRSLEALYAVQLVHANNVAAIGPAAIKDELVRFVDTHEHTFEAIYADEGTSLLDNIQIGLKEIRRFSRQASETGNSDNLNHSDSVVVISPDLPFITGEAIEGFLTRIPADADIAMPIITKKDFMIRFPNAKNRFNKILEGNITLGSVAYMSSSILAKNVGLFQDAHNSRKSVGRLAGMLGLAAIIKLLFGKLSIYEIEERVSQLVDGTVHAVLDCDPVLAYDIDNAANLNFALNSDTG